jgi:hypothetical protein
MNSSQIADHLKNQFLGASVLYVRDLATVLGKSEKAVANLISRKDLPFKVKNLGGLRCVDIYQVAQWLAADDEAAQQALEMPSQPRIRAPKPTNAPAQTFGPNNVTLGNPAVGSMASRIRQMRHDYADPMMRFIDALEDPQKKYFTLELIEILFFELEPPTSSYVASIRKVAPLGHKLREHQDIRHFESEIQATEYLLKKIRTAQSSESKYIWHFELSYDGDEVFEASILDGTVAVLNNEAALALSGI